ncbi:MAG: hypothetical protein OXC71_05240 [Chloroflexi bacterium]|nr:hypothetical protein [Chloroflexota bacterium]
MNLRFHVDPETGDPHIYRHGVWEQEVEDVMGRQPRMCRGAATRASPSGRPSGAATFW